MAPRKPTTKALTTWDEELAKQAAASAAMEENTASGSFFSLKSGVLSFNDSPIPGNEMAVVIVDHILENVYHEGEYDPDDPQGPSCFAFGRDEKVMKPHDIVFEAGKQQNDCCGIPGSADCCPQNEWGSADRGKGKACKNTRRLALLPAGTFDKNGNFKSIEDPEHYENTAIAYMKLPVTSVRGYAAFVKQVAGALKRPPHGLMTKISVVPDAKSQFKVIFEALVQVPNELMGVIMQRHQEAAASIEFPYQLADDEPTAGKGKKKPAAKKRPARKY